MVTQTARQHILWSISEVLGWVVGTVVTFVANIFIYGTASSVIALLVIDAKPDLQRWIVGSVCATHVPLVLQDPTTIPRMK